MTISQEVENTSGQPNAVLPEELKGLNWGAFLLNWIWAIGHKAWLGFALSFFCGLIGAIYLLIKGNEDAWKSRRFNSVEEFKQVQAAWLKWGLIVLVAGVVLGLVFGVGGALLSILAGGHRSRF
ncbi:MAG: hypothetical protein HYU64_05630 [Armatimonadetes bacterium]|nr:hypothetical protein [Armatimonadota bacterium]